MLLHQVDDFAFAIDMVVIGKHIIHDIDQHLCIHIKYLGILQMLNGMDIM